MTNLTKYLMCLHIILIEFHDIISYYIILEYYMYKQEPAGTRNNFVVMILFYNPCLCNMYSATASTHREGGGPTQKKAQINPKWPLHEFMVGFFLGVLRKTEV